MKGTQSGLGLSAAVLSLAASAILLPAVPERPNTDAWFRVSWGCIAPQDPEPPAPLRCVCDGVEHDGLNEADGTRYEKGVFKQIDPGFQGGVAATLLVDPASCECGDSPGNSRCRATATVRVTPNRVPGAPAVVCLDHAGGLGWSCSMRSGCAPRYQCCQGLVPSPNLTDPPYMPFELSEDTLCGSSETAVFPVSRQLEEPGCGAPANDRVADVRFHWSCATCQPEVPADSDGSGG